VKTRRVTRGWTKQHLIRDPWPRCPLLPLRRATAAAPSLSRLRAPRHVRGAWAHGAAALKLTQLLGLGLALVPVSHVGRRPRFCACAVRRGR
jgi:hypothetical protein